MPCAPCEEVACLFCIALLSLCPQNTRRTLVISSQHISSLSACYTNFYVLQRPRGLQQQVITIYRSTSYWNSILMLVFFYDRKIFSIHMYVLMRIYKHMYICVANIWHTNRENNIWHTVIFSAEAFTCAHLLQHLQ